MEIIEEHRNVPGESSDFVIPKEHLINVCKLGKNSACCRYVIGSGKGIECAKGMAMQSLIDRMGDNMSAKGDNCEGIVAVKKQHIRPNIS